MSADLPYRVPTIRRNTVTKALSPITNSYYPLGVTVPRDVINAARDDMVFPFITCEHSIVDKNQSPYEPFLLTASIASQTRTDPDTSPLAT
jgi:hypothetical protein